MMEDKIKMERMSLYLAACLIAVLLGGAAFMWGYGTVVPLKGIGDLKVVPTNIHGRDLTISVSGIIIDSSPGAAITGVSQQRKGNLIIIVVRKGFRLGKSATGRFSINVPVPDDVDAVAYKTPTDVLWHR
ncbi:hypothetical protein AB4Y89_23885 [Terriglobus sp. 2YAB30_2]|uniref:hypothetical protein n=1 Tax=Terriglobus sp. 2YAB30_2 TaxID=3233023 RepID=UPI003F9A6E2E